MMKPIFWLLRLQHHLIYALDGTYVLTLELLSNRIMCFVAVLHLNDAARGPAAGIALRNLFEEEYQAEDLRCHILPVACDGSCQEVEQLDNRRAAVLQGMRDGARRVLQLFLPAQLCANDDEDGNNLNHEEIEAQVEEIVEMLFPLSLLQQSTVARDENEINERDASFNLLRGLSIQQSLSSI